MLYFDSIRESEMRKKHQQQLAVVPTFVNCRIRSDATIILSKFKALLYFTEIFRFLLWYRLNWGPKCHLVRSLTFILRLFFWWNQTIQRFFIFFMIFVKKTAKNVISKVLSSEIERKILMSFAFKVRVDKTHRFAFISCAFWNVSVYLQCNKNVSISWIVMTWIELWRKKLEELNRRHPNDIHDMNKITNKIVNETRMKKLKVSR